MADSDRVRAIARVAEVGGARVTVGHTFNGFVRVAIDGPSGLHFDNTRSMRAAVRAALEACGYAVEEQPDGAFVVRRGSP